MENNRQPYYIALIALLLLINGVLLFNNVSMRRSNKETVANLETEKNTLQTEYDTALKELEMLKVDKSTADTTILRMQEQMEAQKQQIETLLRKGNASKGDLAAARSLIANLRGNIQNYETQIAQLQAANQQLTGENSSLKQDVAVKTQTIAQQTDSLGRLKTEKTNLTVEKESLAEQKGRLEEEKSKLTDKVNRASIMIASNITASAIKTKRSGKEIPVENNRRAQKLRVCFDLLPNAVAPPGNKDVLLRILSPQGNVLAIQSMGSGIFTNAETNEQMQYTRKESIPFTNQKENYCLYWEQNFPFDEGTYTAEVYHDGYMIGTNSFELK